MSTQMDYILCNEKTKIIRLDLQNMHAKMCGTQRYRTVKGKTVEKDTLTEKRWYSYISIR